MIVSNSGAIGGQRRHRELQDRIPGHGYHPHAAQDLETVTEVREGLYVPAPHQCLVGRGAAAQPLGIEVTHIALGERAVFPEPHSLRASQLRRKHRQRPEDQQQQHQDHEQQDLEPVLRQRGAEMKDAVGQVPRKERPVRHQQWNERMHHGGDECEATGPVGMRGDELQRRCATPATAAASR